MRRFHAWYDRLPEPNRFFFFLLFGALPYAVLVWAVQLGYMKIGLVIFAYLMLILFSRMSDRYGWFTRRPPRR